MRVTKEDREVVYGMFDGRCAYCGVALGDRWHADHVEPIIRPWLAPSQNGAPLHPERHCIANLMPACAPCNINKSSLTLEYWRQHRLAELPRFLRRESNYRLALAHGLIVETGAPVIFHYERASLPHQEERKDASQ